MEFRDKKALVNMVEYINKYDASISMGELEEFVGCVIKRDLTNMTLNVSQPDIINKIN